MVRIGIPIIKKDVKFVKFLLNGMGFGALAVDISLRTHPRNNKSRKKLDLLKNRH